MKNLIKLTAFVLFISFVSCQKFADGGLVKKADTRITNTWKLQSYLVDGVDATQSLLISNLIETYSEDGTYSRSYNDTDGAAFDEAGRWNLPDKAEVIDITGVSSLELSDQHSTVSSDHYNINRMKKDEYWYSYTNGGAIHEFRFVPL